MMPLKRNGALFLLSGGLDSGVAMCHCLKLREFGGQRNAAIAFRYGSKHNKYENEKARELAEAFELPFTLVNLEPVLRSLGTKSDLLESGGEVPEGHYAAETMRRTVVPGRNLLMLAAAASMAESNGYGTIVLGVHAGDHAIYPDCRPAFISCAGTSIWLSTDERVAVYAPMQFRDKTGIVALGLELSFPFHMTRTCYKDQEIACGRCGSCQERLEAFHLNAAIDPLDYESRELMPKSGT